MAYNDNHPPYGPIQMRGDAFGTLPVETGSLGYVISSHLLEDALVWEHILTEWTRVLRHGGHLIIIVPERDRWLKALARGQAPNMAHVHEARIGELSSHAGTLGLAVIRDQFAKPDDPTDYSIIFIGRKL
jgi:SAM-dependent methyltransferase